MKKVIKFLLISNVLWLVATILFWSNHFYLDGCIYAGIFSTVMLFVSLYFTNTNKGKNTIYRWFGS